MWNSKGENEKGDIKMPLTKKEEKWKPNPSTVEMFDSSIQFAEDHLERTKEWVKKAEDRLKWAKHRKERYLKDGTWIPAYPKEEGEKEVKTK